jgi:hypothetical protein
MGYGVTAFEASPPPARLASVHCGLPVEVRRFQEVEWHDRFDGIRACASLLHVPMAELPAVLRRLGRALKPERVLYASFKYGSGEREHGERRFTDLDEAGLDAVWEVATPNHFVLDCGGKAFRQTAPVIKLPAGGITGAAKVPHPVHVWASAVWGFGYLGAVSRCK